MIVLGYIPKRLIFKEVNKMLELNLINKTIKGNCRAGDIKEKGLIRASLDFEDEDD